MSRRTTPVLVILAVLLLAPTIATQAASTPYIVSIVDRDSYFQADTISAFTYPVVGDTAALCVWVDPTSGAEDFEGGFDFLISYDAYVLDLIDVSRGRDLAPEWEYFSWRSGLFDSCPGCPDGLVRIVGLCDLNDGTSPPESAYNLTGCIIELAFAVGEDPSLQPSCHLVNFYSMDCTDNAISTRQGDGLYLPISGDIRGPSYDSLACPGTGSPYIYYNGGQVCVGGGGEPPDTLLTPYHAGIMDRDSWTQQGSAVPVTSVDGGGSATMCIWVDPGADSLAEGGFDFLVEFDASAMTLSSVAMGGDLAGEWEYFNYSVLSSSHCTGCPDGLVRVTGVCDLNNETTPPDPAFNLAGCIAELTFTASNDPAEAGTCHSVAFYSVDCGDNTITSRAGDSLYVPLTGDVRHPSYDSAGCSTSGLAAINYTSGLFCINDEQVPPDTLATPYDVRIIDRAWWVGQDSVVSFTTAPSGTDATMCLWVDPASGGLRAEGGFDFLVLFNNDMLSVQSVNRGADLAPEWEYFTWRSGVAADSCLGPSEELLRVVGITDLLNTTTPPDGAFELSGCIAELVFHVTGRPNAFTACSSVGFYSMDCGDNAITTPAGDSLFIPLSGVIYCDGFDPASCISTVDSLQKATPAIRFTPGEVCVDDPPVPSGGDLNLNGIAYEIADAVLYANFIMFGPGVFNPMWIEQQLWESETNCDSLTATLADLAYLWNVITGDLPICNPNGEVPSAGPGPVASGEDTIRAMGTSGAPGDVISIDFYVRNVDTLYGFDFRLRYDPTVIEPQTGAVLGDSTPTLDGVVQLRGAPFVVFGGGNPQPGVVTFLAGQVNQGGGEVYPPGSGATVHTSWRILPSAIPQASLLRFEDDSSYANTYNTMVGVHAENWKRPVMLGSTVIVGSAACDCGGRCDYDTDGYLTAIDLGMLISVLYEGATELEHPACPTSCGDYDGDGATTALDLSKLIDHLYAGKPGPFNPCAR